MPDQDFTNFEGFDAICFQKFREYFAIFEDSARVHASPFGSRGVSSDLIGSAGAVQDDRRVGIGCWGSGSIQAVLHFFERTAPFSSRRLGLIIIIIMYMHRNIVTN